MYYKCVQLFQYKLYNLSLNKVNFAVLERKINDFDINSFVMNRIIFSTFVEKEKKNKKIVLENKQIWYVCLLK